MLLAIRKLGGAIQYVLPYSFLLQWKLRQGIIQSCTQGTSEGL